MAITDHCLADALEDLIELRPFPAAASRLLTACRDENVTAQEISRIINCDPTFAVKLLHIANSPIYGHSGQISSVQHATVIIGLRTLRNLAISTAVGDVFGDGDAATKNARENLWRHSLTCGSMARTLASVTGLAAPDEAFLGGVVHDVGKLFLTDYQPVRYVEMLSARAAQSMLDIELEVFGMAHTSVGGKCSRTWGLPDQISDVICFHHQPADSDYEDDLINVVCAANQFAHLWSDNVTDDDCLAADAVLRDIDVDFSPEEINGLKERSLAELDEILETHRGS